MQPGGNVDAVPEQVAVAHGNLTDMQSSAKCDAAFFRDLVVEGSHAVLNFQCALKPVHGARELGENAVACGIGDATCVCRDKPVRDLATRPEQAQGRSFIGAHEACVALDIRAQDRC